MNARDMVGELQDAIWSLLYDAWEATEDPSIVGAVMSLLMVRFIESYADAADMSPERRAVFFERSVETHAAAIRKALSMKEELN